MRVIGPEVDKLLGIATICAALMVFFGGFLIALNLPEYAPSGNLTGYGEGVVIGYGLGAICWYVFYRILKAVPVVFGSNERVEA